ncbi:hypothetical protein MHLP_02135 [Candidatus Mycoplasma haematolamae str. Purdue]|uniref:Uncharacterized protein n=1 Tax=Mycoplasma haematolamae (strain Purdue) TaxID=1212765 RepID=I7C689_MYCHA|nr:hypothetical protein [Candidatus Mycoplasma haematolamae]AFO52007.1 hypothetical protein MHLP_02135 [Candidatus Mycoplasma haematolamae str. Purdue]
MALLSSKAIAALFVGSGSVAGSGYGVVRYVKYSGESTQKTSLNTTDSLPNAKLASPERPEVLDDTLKIVGHPEQEAQLNDNSASFEDVEEEDDEELEDRVSGTLAVVEGLLGGYELKVYYDNKTSEEDEKVVVEGVAFSAIKELVSPRMNFFNAESWEVEDLSAFLKLLKDKKSDLAKAFDEPSLRALEEKVRAKIGS